MKLVAGAFGKRGSRGILRIGLPAVFAAAVCASSAVSAPTGIGSVVTSTVTTGSSSVRTVATSSASGIQTTYNGIELRIDSFSVSGTSYSSVQGGVAVARRNTGSANPPVFPTDNANVTSGWNQVVSGSTNPASGSSRTVNGVYHQTLDELFTSQDLRTGTENLFVNDGDATNAASNVERMDYIFTGGVAVNPTNGFAVFERNRNGTFKIAVITSLDINGVPNGFSNIVVTVPTSAYGPALTPPGSMNYDVYRTTSPSDPSLGFLNNANIGPQPIGGVFISIADFGLTQGSTVYGYSVFGVDVTGTGSQLVDWNNSTYFPQNSPLSNDMDMVASGAQLYSSVPEPAALALLGFAGALVLWRRRRS